MTAFPQDVVAELKTRIAELEQRLQASSAQNAQLEHALALSRDRQEASAEVLRTIASSPSDAGHSLQQIAETCARLFGAPSVSIQLAENGEWGEAYRFGTSAQHIRSIVPLARIKVNGPNLPGQIITRNEQIDIPDLDHIDPSMAEWPGLPLARAAGTRTMCGTPLRREGHAIGAMIIYRDRHLPFTPDELALLQSFADQAAIAIENARLFNETREALERQIATADILKAIAASPSETGPVFQTIADSTKRLLGGYSVAVFQLIDGNIHLAAYTPTKPAADAALEADFPQPVEMFEAFRFAQNGKPFPIPDTEQVLHAPLRDIARLHGFRSMLWVPVMNGDMPIGVISTTRAEPGAFAPHHVQLLQTFADQAVIAIENSRLFNEVQTRTLELTESLQQQTATADVLKVISRSAFDLQSVLQTLVNSARQLLSTDTANIYLRDGDVLRVRAQTGMTEEFHKFLQDRPAKAERGRFIGRAFFTAEIVHLPDVLADPEYSFPGGPQIGGYRAVLGVPMLREGRVEGVFGLGRSAPGPFTAREIELVRTFADQASIAIENARLFHEVEERTRELARSLDDLRTAQDRLIQTEKLASLGQLTAGIAHEIKNPLNFVNNFSALSAELADELNGILAPSTLPDKTREEIKELTGLLKDNLQKIVQHGKRADSIVKNMLLHSREGSGEHRPTDINALVEESLNLAYHGARAEKPEFEVTIARDLDPSAGMIEVFPQEITRVLLNLISNGLYAVAKRRSEVAGGFEPMLGASTHSHGDRVEIRIRDNGIGIPPDVMDKIFNPFFTTKPAGAGTGLGLSMSHDIIVKQHGGTIDAQTVPGEFTEFTIRLPRRSNFSSKT